MEISACHKLSLTYESKCTAMHGHNWRITVWCRSRELDEDHPFLALGKDNAAAAPSKDAAEGPEEQATIIDIKA